MRLQSKNHVPHVPSGTKILAYTDVVTQKGKRVRLMVSEKWQDRIFGMQVVGCIECPENGEEGLETGEFPVDEKVFGYLRVIWINVDRVQNGTPTLGDYADHMCGKIWMKDDATHDKHFEGRPYFGGRDKNGEFPGVRREICEVWQELWKVALRRNLAWVEMMSVDKEHQRMGVARETYRAMAGIIEMENMALIRSTLLSDPAKAFWQANDIAEAFIAADGEERHRIKPTEHRWKFLSDVKRESGEVLKYNKSLLKAPELSMEVRLSAKCKDLLEGMYIAKEAVVAKSRKYNGGGEKKAAAGPKI